MEVVLTIGGYSVAIVTVVSYILKGAFQSGRNRQRLEDISQRLDRLESQVNKERRP